MHKGKKTGLGHLVETTLDCKHEIIAGLDVYPANTKERSIVLKHMEDQMQNNDMLIRRLALECGYDIGTVYRGLELLGIEGYIPMIPHTNRPRDFG